MMDGVEMGLGRNETQGWAGEIAYRWEAFPDDNEVQTLYGWTLMPITPGIRIGYGISRSDAGETRWSPALQPLETGGGMGFVLSETGEILGRFAPYYTPEEVLSHSILGEVSIPFGSGGMRLNGSWGFKAKEMAPVLYLETESDAAVTFYEREFTPWSISGTTNTPLGTNMSLEASVEHRETAFYGLTRMHLAVVYRFLGGAPVR
jgi:hypothetical protein